MAFTPLAQPNEPSVSAMAACLCRHVEPLDYGTLLTYQDIRKVIFENPQGRRGRAAVLSARTKLLKEHQKLLVNVRDKGYQIALPNEHVTESKRVESLARRRKRWALAITVNTEMAKLTPAERQQIDEQANRLRLLLALDKNLAKATISPTSKDDIVFPIGRRLAVLLQAPPPIE